jgi:transcriptional regulator with XRE-family HTH domain
MGTEMTIGHFLRRMREQNGLTIKEVSDRSVDILDKTTISRIERDERGLSLKAAYALSRIYNVNIIEICEHATGRKINVEHVPFETSLEERRMIARFRVLSSQRKKAVREIIRGLSLVSSDGSPSAASRQLKRTLSEGTER